MNSHISIIGNKLWCPRCQDYEKFLKTHNAAALADITRRTIYRYIDEGKIYAVKVAGNTYRVFSGCLLKSEPQD
jgi:excisionase family DNA binding protein